VAFLNVALYLFMSLVCLWAARPPFPLRTGSVLPLSGHDSKEAALITTLRRLVKKATFGKRETAAICFCGAAKGGHLSTPEDDDAETIALVGLVLGAPLISIMYSAYGDEIQAAVTVPIALYQGTQIAIAQFSVIIVKRWISQGEDWDSESEPEEKECRQGDLNVAEGVQGDEEKHEVQL